MLLLRHILWTLRLLFIGLLLLVIGIVLWACPIPDASGRSEPLMNAATMGLVLLVARHIVGRHAGALAPLDEALSTFTRSCNGRHRPASLTLPFPVVEYWAQGIQVRLESWIEEWPDESAGSGIIVGCRLTARPRFTFPTKFRLEVFPEQFRHTVAKLLGMQDLEIGHPGIDRLCVVQASSIEELRRALSGGLSVGLVQAYEASAHRDLLHVSFNADRLVLQRSCRIANGVLTSTDFVQKFDEAAWSILTALVPGLTMPVRVAPAGSPGPAGVTPSTPARGAPWSSPLPAAEGLTFVEEASVPVEAAHCLVCGGELGTAALRACLKCETPYHGECWEYNGRCALFGCDSSMSRAARPLPPPSSGTGPGDGTAAPKPGVAPAADGDRSAPGQGQTTC